MIWYDEEWCKRIIYRIFMAMLSIKHTDMHSPTSYKYTVYQWVSVVKVSLPSVTTSTQHCTQLITITCITSTHYCQIQNNPYREGNAVMVWIKEQRKNNYKTKTQDCLNVAQKIYLKNLKIKKGNETIPHQHGRSQSYRNYEKRYKK